MVEVEVSALGSFEKEAVSAGHDAMEPDNRIGDERPQRFGRGEVMAERRLQRDGLRAHCAQDGIVFPQACFEFFGEFLGVKQIADPQSGARRFVAVRRTDAALGCADFVFPFTLFTGLIERAVPGHDEVGAIAEQEVFSHGYSLFA